MKKIRYIILISIITMFFLALILTVTAQEPRQIILTWQDDPQTTMTITWRTDYEGEKSMAYFSSDDSLAIDSYKYQEAETFTLYSNEGTAAWLHSVELTGLNPGETYWTVVQTDEHKSEKFSFRTAPDEPKDLVFVAGSDLQLGIDIGREIHKKAIQEDPEFVLFSGDLINEALSEFEWDRWLDAWDELMITEEGRRIPILPSMGNHEVVGAYGGTKELAPFYYNRFVLPGIENYYVLQYGPDLTIITLDSDHSSPIDGEQLSWLESTLKEYQDRKWIIAQHHVPALTDEVIRNFWVPLYEEYKVDLVHNGHAHVFRRSVPVSGLETIVAKINDIIEEGLIRAKETFDPKENYAPPAQQNFIKLARGDWEGAGFASLTEGLEELAYKLSLFIIQTGEATKERLREQLTNTQLYKNFWDAIFEAGAEGYEDLIDEENGVLYVVGGLWGSSGDGSIRDPQDYWWLEDAKNSNGYIRYTLDILKDELRGLPNYYDPKTDKWEEGNEFVIKN